MPKLFMVFIVTATTLGISGIGQCQDNVESTNKAIEVTREKPAGDVTNVNGSVNLEANAKARDIRTANGAVILASGAQAARITTTNAAISLTGGAFVLGDIITTNGAVSATSKSDVHGAIHTVHGDVQINDAHVARGIHTTSGNIIIGAGAHVEGGITVDKQESFLQWGNPTVIIGPHAVVEGPLEFKQKVDLKVSDSAKIGPVTGASVQIFNGASP